MKKSNMKIVAYVTTFIGIALLLVTGYVEYKQTGEINTNYIEEAITMLDKVNTYHISDEEIKELPSSEIVEQTIEEEQEVGEEQATTEVEGFELQGEIAFEGDKVNTWNVELGDYKGLTYYSQIDSRWKNKLYTSVGDSSQTIGSSGCGPTSAAMVVTATKGVITPDIMADLFVKYGYRSANNGTYYSAFRAVADEFNIGYEETTDIQRALQLLQSQHYIVCSVGNGLFTTGGHFIVLVGIENDTIKIYDPYLYSGKFETSTRRSKVTVDGNTVYCSVDNFRNYANYMKFFAFKNEGTNQENNYKPVVVSTYTRYVKANGGLRVRNNPNGTIVGLLQNGTQVIVYETSSNWSRIGDSQWVCSDYLYETKQTTEVAPSTKKVITGYTTGKYKVNANILNVRYGAGTNYKAKTWRQLTANARSQNQRLGNYYTNGLRKGVVTTVTKVVGSWGLTPSGYINLTYCTKL